MLVSESEQLYSAPFESEAELERVVWEYSELLFGSSAIFLPKARIGVSHVAQTIPDGFAIDLESNRWFIVEAELASHGTWHHIAPQVSKQITALEAPETREKILGMALEVIQENEQLKDAIEDLGIREIEIHGRLQAVLRQPPVVAIPIDAIPKDLESWTRSLKYDVQIWIIEKYVTLDGTRIMYSLPEQDSPTLRPRDNGAEGEPVRSSQPYADLISAGFIQAGQAVHMTYGPRGKPKMRFEGILRDEGVELEGTVMSLSAAALVCIRKTNSERRSVNGWKKWKTDDGETLNEVYSRYEQTAVETNQEGA